VTKRPGSRVFIPPGSLPGRLFRCLKRSIASRIRLRNHASKRCYFQPRALPQALPPGPVLGQAHRYHALFMPRLPTSTWILGLSTTTPYLSVYADPRMVQANLSLSQRSNQLPAFPAILQFPRIEFWSWASSVGLLSFQSLGLERLSPGLSLGHEKAGIDNKPCGCS